jgi:predicted RNA-binding Zn-ribbon protein involved in translation (DUF1610 family)
MKTKQYLIKEVKSLMGIISDDLIDEIVSALESQEELKPSDEDIETWAEKCCEAIPDESNRILAETYRILGAKAMRDNKIPTSKTESKKVISIVRDNLMTIPFYSPLCGSIDPACSMPRSKFNGSQFVCPKCGWKSAFPDDFIKEYKEKWNL